MSECPVYRTTPAQKLRAQIDTRMYKLGKPKLRDLLREKCRIRMHEARQACFENMRNINRKDIKVDELVRKELEDIEQNINLQDEIYKELVDEINAWFVTQLEQEENFLIDIETNDAILCPVCQKAQLKCIDTHLFECECKAKFSFAGSMDLLRETLKTKIDEHERYCLLSLCFFVEPQTSGIYVLNALCGTCDYFSSL